MLWVGGGGGGFNVSWKQWLYHLLLDFFAFVFDYYFVIIYTYMYIVYVF